MEIPNSELGKYAEQILDFYLPLVAKLPLLRDDPRFLQENIKATGESGITDVATKADIVMQNEIREQVSKHFPSWQFWGEEGEMSKKVEREFLFVCDPIEGTNNFKYGKDEMWGSVVAVVRDGRPVLGVVVQPSQRRAFLGIRRGGSYCVKYDEDGSVESIESVDEPEHSEFTYNNSPHFEERYLLQVQQFFSRGKLLPGEGDELDQSRKSVVMEDGVKFVDVECGALEPFLFRGGIMFKTNIELAAVFVILGELGGKVTDGNGELWSPDISSLVFARSEEDWNYLKNIYDTTKV